MKNEIAAVWLLINALALFLVFNPWRTAWLIGRILDSFILRARQDRIAD